MHTNYLFLLISFSILLFVVIYEVIEYALHCKRLERVKIRIHVNGTRGVSDDPFHAGRDDELQRINARVNYALKDNVNIFLGYQYEINNAKVFGTNATQGEESILGHNTQIVRGGIKVDF